MRPTALTALLLAACHPGSDDAFPIVPGGDDTQILPAPDAALPDDASGDAAMSISGRVCVVLDLRNLTSCTTGDASGITVTLGTSTAVTAVDGSFMIATSEGTNLVWTATAPDLVPTVMPLSVVHLIPVVIAAQYAEMLLGNGVILQAGEGSVFVRVIRSGAPAAGVVAAVNPPSQYGPLYDDRDSAVVWELDATDTGGVVWIPDVDALQGTATLSLLAPAGTPVMVSLPVVDGANTFATVGIP